MVYYLVCSYLDHIFYNFFLRNKIYLILYHLNPNQVSVCYYMLKHLIIILYLNHYLHLCYLINKIKKISHLVILFITI